MGMSLGGTSSKSQASSTQANTYTPGQSGLQDTLMSAFSSLLPGISAGGISPNVQNMATANADTINKSYQSTGDRLNRYLAARGFGQSGTTGKAALQTELGRQGALAGNVSDASANQLNLDATLLSDSLLAAFNKIGVTGTGTNAGSSSGWGISAGGGMGGVTSGGLGWGIG